MNVGALSGIVAVAVTVDKQKGNNMDIDTIVNYLGYVIAALTAVVSLYKSHKAGQTLAQSLIVLANTLKDENKMVGGQFTLQTVAKAEEVARQIGANDQAIEQVKEALKGRQIDVKLGSWKGKPIYLSDALKVGGIADAVRRLFK